METGVWMTNHMIVIQGIQGRQTMHSPTVQLWSATVTVTMILDTRTWTRTTRTWELQYPQPHHHQVQKICRAQPDQLCQCLLHPCRRPQNMVVAGAVHNPEDRWYQGSDNPTEVQMWNLSTVWVGNISFIERLDQSVTCLGCFLSSLWCAVSSYGYIVWGCDAFFFRQHHPNANHST